MNEEYIWLMDSEYCGNCGAALNLFETDLCHDCIENARFEEEQAFNDAWFYWPEEEVR